MKRLRLLLSLVLTAACLLSVLSGCGTAAPVPEDSTPDASDTAAGPEDTEEAPAPEPFLLTENGKCAFRLVRSVNADEALTEWTMTLRDNLEQALGCRVEIGHDYTVDGKHDESAYEILVGITSYAQAEPVQSTLLYNDYTVCLVGHKLLLCARNLVSLIKASNWLLNKALPQAVTDGTRRTLTFAPYTVTKTYEMSDFTIGGHPIGAYRLILAAKPPCYEQAEAIAKVIAERTGYMLPTDTDSSAPGELEILIGPTRRLPVDCDNQMVRVYTEGTKLVVSCGGSRSAEYALNRMLDELQAAGKTDLDASYRLECDWLPDPVQPRAEGTDYRIMSYNLLTQTYDNDVTETATRAELLGRILEKYQPDAMGVQEVCSFWKKFISYYAPGYKLICTVRDDNGSNYSSILYNTEKYDVKASGVVPYTMSANKNCRNMGWAVFTDKQGKVLFALISTHWDFDSADKDGNAYRKAQGEQMAEFVARLSAEYGCPVFTTGDYNCGHTSDSMTYFRSINHMWCSKFDAKTYGNKYGTSGGYLKEVADGGKVIDFVFGTLDTECLFNMVVVNCGAEEISDHRATVADIRVK